jgi:hypothetical protein
MLSPLVSGDYGLECGTVLSLRFRPVPTIVKDRALQCSPGSQEQGGGQDFWKVLIGLFPDGGLRRWAVEAARLCVFILLSYPCSVCVHQNDDYAHA